MKPDGAPALDSIEITVHIRLEDGKMVKATIRIEVTDPGPTLVDDEVTTGANVPVDIKPLENDSDPLDRRLRIVRIEQPAQGSAILVDETTIRYTPPLNYVGPAEMVYEAEPADA